MGKTNPDLALRVLVACSHCTTQYDVTGQPAKSNVHCRCGTVIVVPEARVHEARLVRCASCGGSRGKGGENCEFCGARFSSVDKGWGTMCPGCYARLPNDAGYCVDCGVRINPQKLEAVRSDLKCPRCTTALQARLVSNLEMYECASCAGLWLPEAAFEDVMHTKEGRDLATRGKRNKNTKFELDPGEQVKYVPCPICKNLMNRRNFGRVSGVIVDTCKDHGVWLDNNELNRIVHFIEAGGMTKMREFEKREAEHSQKMATSSAAPAMPSAGGSLMTSSNSSMGDAVIPVLARVVFEIARAFLKR